MPMPALTRLPALPAMRRVLRLPGAPKSAALPAAAPSALTCLRTASHTQHTTRPFAAAAAACADTHTFPMSAAPFRWPQGATLGFIGAGAMASAIAKGIDLNPDVAADLAARGVYVTRNNSEVASRASVLLLATKPAALLPALRAEAAAFQARRPLLISVAAGVSIASLEAALPPGARVARVMPNTPALVGAGASGFAMGSQATEEDARTVEALFNSTGLALRVAESDLTGVTGVSGSGPAFVFQFTEALADGGVRAGLTRAVAYKLAVQTVLGSAKLMQEGGKHPGELKDQVASPGGTTIAGIHALEKGGMRGTVMDAVMATATRAEEMGKPKSKL